MPASMAWGAGTGTTRVPLRWSRCRSYEDTAFFGRLFQRRTGMTPARYRQRYRGATTRLVS